MHGQATGTGRKRSAQAGGTKGVSDENGADRVLLNPDCGFATFADNPISSAQVAEGKLRAMAEASQELRRRHFGPRT